MLGTLRLLFKDLVTMERLEYGEATAIVEDTASLSDEMEAALSKAYGNDSKKP